MCFGIIEQCQQRKRYFIFFIINNLELDFGVGLFNQKYDFELSQEDLENYKIPKPKKSTIIESNLKEFDITANVFGFLKAELDNLKALRKLGFSDEMRDVFKGHLDFVTNQLLDTVY